MQNLALLHLDDSWMGFISVFKIPKKITKTKKEAIKMPKGDGTGPPKGSKGPHNGRGGGKGRAPGKGSGSKSGGKKGKC